MTLFMNSSIVQIFTMSYSDLYPSIISVWEERQDYILLLYYTSFDFRVTEVVMR